MGAMKQSQKTALYIARNVISNHRMQKYYKQKPYSNPAKAKAWKYFSKYIRLRDALKTTSDIYFCRCITCGKIKPMDGSIHAGHAIAGRMNSILFNECLVHGQCKTCNETGQYAMYEKIIIDMYGQEKWDYWQSTKSTHVDYSNYDYEQIAKTYREKVKRLI